MQVFRYNGICLYRDGRAVYLDPSRGRADGVVTHGHSDHLRPGTVMTPPTADFLRVRTGSRRATPQEYHAPFMLNGFTLELLPAGHVLGAAMVACDGVLYTGDFNPAGTITAGRAAPRECETLIIESTYGKPGQALPPRESVVRDLQAWLTAIAAETTAIVGAYPLGKAQEVVAAANAVDLRPMVSKAVGDLCDIYRAHGVPLEYHRYEALSADERTAPGVLVTSSAGFGGRQRPNPAVTELRRRGGRTARVSGWCAFADWGKRGVDASFPLSDHADFPSLLDFVAACRPQQVFTVHGATKHLAAAIERELGIAARPLPKKGDMPLEVFN